MEFEIAKGIKLGNKLPFVAIAGVNVLESRTFALEVAAEIVSICAEIGVTLIFKASFDKANRSSINSFRGPGLDEGLAMLRDIKEQFHCPLVTDVHSKDQVQAVGDVVDVIQIPAFLARQTDLVVAVACAGRPVNIKKPQFMSPAQVRHVVEKCWGSGNDRVMVCERGTMFGYDNLVVDMLGFGVIKRTCKEIPLIFDVTHSLQTRGLGSAVSGGRREQAFELAQAGMATGLAGVFVECHPDPDRALCDGPSALRLDNLRSFLLKLKAIDSLVKGQEFSISRLRDSSSNG